MKNKIKIVKFYTINSKNSKIFHNLNLNKAECYKSNISKLYSLIFDHAIGNYYQL